MTTPSDTSETTCLASLDMREMPHLRTSSAPHRTRHVCGPGRMTDRRGHLRWLCSSLESSQAFIEKRRKRRNKEKLKTSLKLAIQSWRVRTTAAMEVAPSIRQQLMVVMLITTRDKCRAPWDSLHNRQPVTSLNSHMPEQSKT